MFICLILLVPLLSSANSFVRIQGLQELDNSTILEIGQNDNGSIRIRSREGCFSYDGYSLTMVKHYDDSASNGIRECMDNEGNRYEVSGHGLFMTDADGRRREMGLQGELGQPVTCVFRDRDGNIWAGTYYNGLFFKGAHNSSLDIVDIPPQMKNLRSLVVDRKDRVWAFTDNVGVYMHNSGTWMEIPGLEGLKFQNACYDRDNDRVWAFDSENGLYCIDCRSRRAARHDTGRRLSQVFALLWTEGSLYIGGRDGLHVFNPVSRTLADIPGIGCAVYDIHQDNRGKIWIAGGGLYSVEGGRVRLENGDPLLAGEICHDIDSDDEGNIWIAVIEHGVACVRDGKATFYNERTNGILSDYVNTVTCTESGRVVIGSRGGISVLDPHDMTTMNFGENAGVFSNSTSGRSSIMLSDGTVWVGNSHGIAEYHDDHFDPVSCHRLAIDRIYIDGIPGSIANGRLVLTHKQSGISLHLSDYDYERTAPMHHELMVNGKDGKVATVKLAEPLSFSEMSPGRHEITIRSTDINSGVTEDLPLTVRVRPAWYACTAAEIIYVLIFLFIAATISHGLRARKELENRLRQSEIEKEKSSNFFVDLSYSIRTPLNVIVGMFENFFKEYGRRSAGTEQLEEIYQNSIKVRELLATCIDSQEALHDDTHSGSEETRRNVRFINAATGAIERKLFSGEKMDVGELCREMHMGKTQLTAQFREATGVTPRQFIEDVKLKHAYNLLQEGNMRINEISALLNFSSPGYFTSKFKSKFGFPPNDCRKAR